MVCGAVTVVVGTAVAASRWSNHDPTLPKASCGSAVTFDVDGETRITTAQPGALTCFDTAARGCGSASIQVAERGVDARTTYVFSIEPGGAACQAVELSQHYSAISNHSGRISSLTCHNLAATSAGVTFTCGGQAVLIPASVH